ncbi:hypothetical protein AB0F72_09320 [Actinoplanes sp. NPDC023936]|uniref:hypothetical protein n=1 Tax=Actinoplanes sp. NPDC023936 TaxID=3154910 RepID=UPI0034038DF4
MSIIVTGQAQGTPYGSLYDHDVRMKPMGVEALRKTLGPEIQQATEEEAHIVVQKHGKDLGVFVPMAWYRKAREAMGEPTDR